MGKSALSPTPDKKQKREPAKPKMLGFSEAITAIAEGNKVTRKDWKDESYYGILKDGRLKIHKPDGELYDWIISDGDMLATDWILI